MSCETGILWGILACIQVQSGTITYLDLDILSSLRRETNNVQVPESVFETEDVVFWDLMNCILAETYSGLGLPNYSWLLCAPRRACVLTHQREFTSHAIRRACTKGRPSFARPHRGRYGPEYGTCVVGVGPS